MAGYKTREKFLSFIFSLPAICLLVTGCSHRHVSAAPPPPPPQMEAPAPVPIAPGEEAGRSREHVLSTETGIASWYGAPYHNARSANGRVYDQNAYTAAHRTLPMGSIVRVTNLSTRQSVVVTITDRGPFVPGRMLDLSRAAALKIGVWRTGTARVRLEVLRMPADTNPDGRWCVQIGVLARDRTAHKLHERLQHEYPTAHVIDFKGATGYWVRIRPANSSHRAAIAIARNMRLNEGEAYLVRLD
jgi:rare lipoprotein A